MKFCSRPAEVTLTALARIKCELRRAGKIYIYLLPLNAGKKVEKILLS